MWCQTYVFFTQVCWPRYPDGQEHVEAGLVQLPGEQSRVDHSAHRREGQRRGGRQKKVRLIKSLELYASNQGDEVLISLLWARFEVYERLGTVEVQDQIEAARYLAAHLPIVDPRRVAIWGWSYGGYATLRALSHPDQDIFQCGIAVSPVTDWRFYGNSLGDSLRLLVLETWLVLSNRRLLPETFADNYEKFPKKTGAFIQRRTSITKSIKLLIAFLKRQTVHLNYTPVNG